MLAEGETDDLPLSDSFPDTGQRQRGVGKENWTQQRQRLREGLTRAQASFSQELLHSSPLGLSDSDWPLFSERFSLSDESNFPRSSNPPARPANSEVEENLPVVLSDVDFRQLHIDSEKRFSTQELGLRLVVRRDDFLRRKEKFFFFLSLDFFLGQLVGRLLDTQRTLAPDDDARRRRLHCPQNDSLDCATSRKGKETALGAREVERRKNAKHDVFRRLTPTFFKRPRLPLLTNSFAVKTSMFDDSNLRT
ncbi:hypothetical protein TGP89_360810 [Toxoplasma gondii p89]|uniref:Uncharacterized protein n=1 Tax=Toxoplasma gondii p89 TaxID=943119 RepID=A0A086KS30_TOXGO|nr:hypothetical protein TGP89_360810 [Toxoplasma gondii p89]